MARQDFSPGGDGEFIPWVEAFSNQLAFHAPSVGVLPAEVATVQGMIAVTVGEIGAATMARNAAQSATAAKNASRQTTEATLRALVRRIKAHPAYTEAVGQDLDVIGPEDTTDLATARPTLTATSVLAGAVTIGFTKSIADGVRISSKRGAESGFTFLATDTTSPYVDNRANQSAGPETREYQAQYFDQDQPVGLLSDPLVVTVPA